MICEICKQNDAIVHIKKIINGKVTKLDLCELCAKNTHQFDISSTISLQDFLKGLISFANTDADSMPSELSDESLKCPKCGLTYHELTQGGKFGCKECYKSFKKQLPSVLKRIHGSLKHEGKIPKTKDKDVSRERILNKYKEELKTSITKEEYEEAARLRDLIREIEKEIKNG